MTQTRKDYLDAIAGALEDYYSEAYDEAANQCQQALKINPDGSEGYYILGLISFDLGNPGKACQLIEKAHQMDDNIREYVDVLANIMTKIGRLSDGLYYAKLSVAVAPHPEIRNLMPSKLNNYFQTLAAIKPQEHMFNATIGYQSGDTQGAIKNCLQELDINPANVEALRLLAKSYIQDNQFQEALIPLKSAQNIDPGNPDDDMLIGQTMLGMGQREVSRDSFQRAMDMAPENAKYHNAYIRNLAYQDDKHWKAFPAIHKEFIEDDGLDAHIVERGREIIDACLAERDKAIKTYGPKKFIRIGLLSNLFFDCIEARWIESFIRSYDRTLFEVYGYHDNTKRDDVTTRLEGMMDSWRPFNEIDDLTAANIIANDDIDVLIDLSGFCDTPRFEILKLHPAKKQVSWLGLPEVGGIDGIDFILSDDISIESDKQYSADEGCISLGKSIIAVEPMQFMPDIKKAPCLADQRINFGGILIPSRLNEKTLSLWADVLDAVPSSVLRLGNPVNSHADTLAYCDLTFKSRGLQNRVIVETLPTLNSDRHPHNSPIEDAHFYHDIDILLDSTTVSGAKETILGLWMGVPVITLSGNRRVSLLGSSILNAADCRDWIGADEADFIRIAQDLAADFKALDEIRSSLRGRVAATQLFSPKTFTLMLQKALSAIAGAD